MATPDDTTPEGVYGAPRNGPAIDEPDDATDNTTDQRGREELRRRVEADDHQDRQAELFLAAIDKIIKSGKKGSVTWHDGDKSSIECQIL